MSLLFGAIADDLTGGLELAAMLCANGVRCDLVSDPRLAESDDGSSAIVVAQRSRVAPRQEAVQAFDAAARSLLARNAKQIFFKYCATFDSTDEGNIGPCADVLRKLTRSALTLFAPSFPEAGRCVFQGHMFVGRQLLSESPKRHDPLTPMTDPNLTDVLQRQTKIQVGLLPHDIVRAGLEAMRRWSDEMERQEIGYAIADAALPEDLAAIAALIVDRPLATGGSSIAAYYPDLWRARGWLDRDHFDRPSIPPVSGAGVVLAGSCADKTLRQLEAFAEKRPTMIIDLHDVAGDRDIASDAIEWAIPHLERGPVGIATSARADAVESVQSHLGRQGAAGLAESLLGQIAVRLRDAGARRFLIAGGETSGAVLDHLGVRRLRTGAYKAPGLAQAFADGNPSLAFCLKSGKLGPDDMFLPMLESMERGEG
jgi:3-dehydrotetronate 4-kinase